MRRRGREGEMRRRGKSDGGEGDGGEGDEGEDDGGEGNEGKGEGVMARKMRRQE